MPCDSCVGDVTVLELGLSEQTDKSAICSRGDLRQNDCIYNLSFTISFFTHTHPGLGTYWWTHTKHIHTDKHAHSHSWCVRVCVCLCVGARVCPSNPLADR